MKLKWYLKTWFICLLFIPTLLAIGAPFLLIFPAIGFVLILIQSKTIKKYNSAFSNYEKVEEARKNKESELHILEEDYQKKELELNNQLKNLQNQISQFSEDLLLLHYTFSDYDGITSEECKNKLALIKNEENDLIKSNNAVIVKSSGTKKEINDNVKQILRCFNSECDNVLMNLSAKNIDTMRNKITKSFETLNRIFQVDGISLNQKILDYKLQELNLAYTYELKKQQELEIQKEIKARMIDEEKARKEIELRKTKIDKDQQQFSNEVRKLMGYLQKSTNDIEKQLYADKIRELEEKIKSLEKEKEKVLEREANARAGFVYVISNIGSFGEGVYKIGMTRRLEPMDRVKELSSASVPFEFDVHAMIFSEDAPALETALHQTFEAKSVNRVNLRKEFFRVSIDEIENVVKSQFNNTVEFTRIPVAKEYRQTLSILESEK